MFKTFIRKRAGIPYIGTGSGKSKARRLSSVYQAFASTARRAPDHGFLHIPASACETYSASAIDFSYAEMLRAVDQCAEIYRGKGYVGAVRIALLLENRPEFFIHWLALNKLGCSILPLSTESRPEEIAYFLGHGEAVAAVCANHLPARRDVDVPVTGTDLATLPPRAPDRNKPVDGATECALLYTSGSTGRPKGCLLSNEYFTCAGHRYHELGGLAALNWGEERLLTPLPLTHMNALVVSTMAMITSAGCLIQLDRFHPHNWWRSVRDSAATVVHYLGVVPAILLELSGTEPDNFAGQVKFGFGAGVNPKHQAVFEARFGFPLLEAWAMTESGMGGAIIANREPRHVGAGCFGRAPDHLEYQLVDEHKNTVARGLAGELRVRARGDNPGKGFFSGYLKNAGATAEAWRGGWLNTGDIVREDRQGNLYFVDRRANMMRRSGENISALEVETCLSQHPDIGEVVVCAVPDDLRGDEVAACVVLAPRAGKPATAARRIVAHALDKLAYFKAPGYVIFCEELPKTASNKPRRGEIKKLAGESLASADCFDTRRMKKRLKSG